MNNLDAFSLDGIKELDPNAETDAMKDIRKEELQEKVLELERQREAKEITTAEYKKAVKECNEEIHKIVG